MATVGFSSAGVANEPVSKLRKCIGEMAEPSLCGDFVVIGSGMGGGTVALALARRGADVLLLERGQRLPREPQNWSAQAVFVERRYKPTERWLDAAGRDFAP